MATDITIVFGYSEVRFLTGQIGSRILNQTEGVSTAIPSVSVLLDYVLFPYENLPIAAPTSTLHGRFTQTPS